MIAVKLNILTRKTLGGFETDLAGRVFAAGEDIFPGLYAAGEASGFGGGGVHGYPRWKEHSWADAFFQAERQDAPPPGQLPEFADAQRRHKQPDRDLCPHTAWSPDEKRIDHLGDNVKESMAQHGCDQAFAPEQPSEYHTRHAVADQYKDDK